MKRSKDGNNILKICHRLQLDAIEYTRTQIIPGEVRYAIKIPRMKSRQKYTPLFNAIYKTRIFPQEWLTSTFRTIRTMSCDSKILL